MSYRSNWNDLNELKCLLIFKQLENENFPRGMQKRLCEEMAKVTILEFGSINAKIGNIKSLAGVNNSSNVSKNTLRIFNDNKHLSIAQLKKITN